MNSKQNRSSEKSLEIAKISASDIEYFEQLFKRYYKPLIHFAYRYIRDEQSAEDIIHDVFINIWRDREKLDFGKNIKTYLYNAVRNRSLKYLKRKDVRSQSAELEIFLEADKNSPENILLNKELKDSITSAINELPEKRREIFTMSRFDQLTYSEIASLLNISVKTVETQMSRALKFLHNRLSQFIHSIIL